MINLLNLALCGSRKYPYLHHRGSLEILRTRGVLKAKFFKEKYNEPKLEFPEGWGGGFKPKSPLLGEYGYFLEQHTSNYCRSDGTWPVN